MFACNQTWNRGPEMTKFAIALREIGTYKEVLRSQIEHTRNTRLLHFSNVDLQDVKIREKFLSLRKSTRMDIAAALEEELQNARSTFEQTHFNLVGALSIVEAKKRFEFLEAVGENGGTSSLFQTGIRTIASDGAIYQPGTQFSSDTFFSVSLVNIYERKEMDKLVDKSLNGDFDVEEALRFFKIGLLCTQDIPKLRPSMSTVVKMLTGERDTDAFEITKPGLISDFMDLKVKSNTEPEPDEPNTINTT